jgi:hypothetical protein
MLELPQIDIILNRNVQEISVEDISFVMNQISG